MGARFRRPLDAGRWQRRGLGWHDDGGRLAGLDLGVWRASGEGGDGEVHSGKEASVHVGHRVRTKRVSKGLLPPIRPS